MHIKLSLFLSLLILSTLSHSQSIMGKWYMVNRSGLVEFNISPDSLVQTKRMADLSRKPRRGFTTKAFNIVYLPDRIVWVLEARRDTGFFSTMTLYDLVEGKSLKLAWNIEVKADNIDSLLVQNQAYKEFHGFNLYAESYLDTLRAMNAPETMSREEFKTFLKLFFSKKQKSYLAAQKVSGYMFASTLAHQHASETLYEMGFNPIQHAGQINTFFEKFHKDPEIEKLLNGFMKK